MSAPFAPSPPRPRPTPAEQRRARFRGETGRILRGCGVPVPVITAVFLAADEYAAALGELIARPPGHNAGPP